VRCARCGRDMEYVEAAINDRKLCHPDDEALPDCYSIESREDALSDAEDAIAKVRLFARLLDGAS
jgi:hypothetical protein